MITALKKYSRDTADFIWHYDLNAGSAVATTGIKFLRTLLVIFNDLSKGQISLHASSLVYTTLLSLVPFLAVSFSILKAVGLHNAIEPALLNLLGPLGKQSATITTQIIETVENIQVGVLGVVGTLFLLYTSIALLGKVENIFNKTWRVKPAQSWAQRISKYISVLVIGPILIGLALAGTATLSSGDLIQNFLGTLGLSAWETLITRMIPYAVIIVAFTFFYMFVPNTRVKLRSALAGAVLAGLLWESIGWIFTTIVVSSANYDAIYSGLAMLVLLIIWLYLSWTILLLGASFAFYSQHPESIRRHTEETGLSICKREQLALSVLHNILQSFYKGTAAPTIINQAQCFNQSPEIIEAILLPLEKNGLLVKSDQQPAGYLPGKAPETIPLSEVLNVIRADTNQAYFDENSPSRLKEIMDKTAKAIQQATANETLADLINIETNDKNNKN
jgi:membrane protein